MFSMFPNYHKKYDVSVAEFTFSVPPKSFSAAKLKGNGQPILQMEHLAYDVFYPSITTSTKGFHWLPGWVFRLLQFALALTVV